MAEELMVEEKSRLSVLVIEDNPDFARQALKGLDGNIVAVVTTLVEASELIKNIRFDVILSDVHVPVREGEEPTAIVSEIIEICRSKDIPVCFVTRADHHGMLELGDEGYVSLKATTMGRVLQSELGLWGKETSEKDLFRKLKTASSENVKSGSKTPEIWNKALEMAMNAKANPTSVGRATRQVGKLGLGVVADKGMPKVVPRK